MGNGERVGVAMGADTKANARAAGALEVGDLRILEGGGEREGALVSDLILSETVSEGWRGGAVREQACQQVLTGKLEAAAHFRLVMLVSLRMAASAVTPLFPIPLLLRLRARGKMETVRE